MSHLLMLFVCDRVQAEDPAFVLHLIDDILEMLFHLNDPHYGSLVLISEREEVVTGLHTRQEEALLRQMFDQPPHIEVLRGQLYDTLRLGIIGQVCLDSHD